MKSTFYHLYTFCMVVLVLCGCQSPAITKGIDDALAQAKGNREELFKVIQHYQTDSLKLKAVFFLLENMSGKYYLSGKGIDEYYVFIDSVYQIRQEEYDISAIYEAFSSRARFLKEQPIVCKDVEILSSDYLVENIDMAFQVWGKPWNNHLSFEEFCEYILPYRIGTEIPGTWRRMYQRVFSDVLVDTIRTAREACIAINNQLIERPIHLATSSVMPVPLRPGTLLNMKFGLCDDYASLAVYAMRSVGIPVVRASVPHWGRGNGAHVFNAVYDNDGTYHDFSGAEQNPDEHLIRFRHEMPKVYRETFGKQAGSLALQHGQEDIPPFFKNACMADATGDYPFIGAKDIPVTLPEDFNNRFAYLCVFDPAGWTPVAWSCKEGGQAVFKDMGPNIVYHVASYEDGQIHPVGSPFLLDTLGHIVPFIPQKTQSRLVLERKNPKAANLAYLPPLMIGCKFQGADNAEFRNASDLYTITTEPDFKYITVSTNIRKPVKYVRYRSSDQTWGNMSEVEFYSEHSNTPLTGKVIGKYVPSMYYPRNGVANLFDGDPLTFFHSNNTLSWGGLELEKATVISQIRYIIRNDDNGIRRGHEYELFYMSNGQWLSLGKQVATRDDEIMYENVPQGALYWLRDYTKGREERIFEVKDNIVIWH